MTRTRKIGLVLLLNSAGGLLPAMFMQMFASHPSWHEFVMDLYFGLIYSFSIGTLAFTVMDRVAPRLMCLPRIYTVTGIVAALVLIATAGSMIANGLFVLLGMSPAEAFWHQLGFGLRIAILSTVLIGGEVTLFESLSHRLQAARLELSARQVEEERARKLASEARLSSLESRVHPHFLFNTLNSISALIREDPVRAERTVERLAALLRYSLDTGRRALVPLRQELRVVQDYLEIEKTRFGGRLRFSLDVPEGMEELEVPPMAVQTLVENSIKHAVSSSRHGGEIAVVARWEAGSLVIAVSDDGPGFDLRSLKEGHGLDILQERLTNLFDGQGRMEIARRGERMVVSVSIPQKKVLA